MKKRIYSFGMSSTVKQYWTAFYTKPRNEKKVAERLDDRGFEVYCPTRTVLKQWSDRKKKVKEPVFTSYLFAKVDELSRAEILTDSGIVSNVFWLGKPAIIREKEIQEIKNFLDEYPMAEVNYSNLNEGDRIAIESGPLSGNDGIISRIRGNKAYLSIASLGIEIQAEVSLSHLKKVG